MSRKRIFGAVGVALAAAIAVSGTAAPAQAAVGDEFNPFDAAGGYSIYAREDAVLGNAETEGAIAVGGTLAVRADGGGYAVLHVSAGTGDYGLPTVDGEPTRLLIGGFATTDNGRVEVTGAGSDQAGAVKLTPQVDSPFGFYERGGWIRYRLTDAADADQPPLIDARGQAWPGDAEAAAAALTTEQPTIAGYVESEMTWTYDEAAQCLADVADPATGLANHVGIAEDVGDRVVLTELAEDRPNVVEYADIAGAGLIQFSGAVTPGPANPLIVHVGGGTTTVLAPRTDSSAYAPYLMWDLSAVTGAVEVRAASARIDGSVYAPAADLTVHAQPIDGQIIARDLHLSDRSGEAHAYFFRGVLPCVPQQQTGGFTVTKDVTGDGAGLVPDDAEFTVEYVIDGAAPVSLTLGAGETSAVIDGLPIGTEVALREVQPTDTDEMTWAAPTWSVDGSARVPDEQGWVSFTVTGSTGVEVTLTNTVAPVPVDPESPDPEEPDPESPDPESPDPEEPDPESPDPESPDPEEPGTEEPGTDEPAAGEPGTGSMPATGADMTALLALAASLAAAGLGVRRIARVRRR
ncbi:collagen-binding domain-containing protein [Occultella kanbiaonis]|uniref:collagen-binding domain-containing protein n=1 Tax=Occultella kanbiaonis TaxID=2675754 RepID=UPI0013D6B074|nr:collagen-binding domain-containing protein [Occultella kanbiaonis]